MLFHISPSLSVITLSVVPAVILGAAGYSRVVKRLSRELLDALAASTQVGGYIHSRDGWTPIINSPWI